MLDEQRIHDGVIDVFDKFLRGDDELIAQVRSFGNGLRIDQDGWRFRLPDLYELISLHDTAVRELGYKRFRNVLYRLPINLELAGRGAEVVVAGSAGKVDENSYLLRVRASRGESCGDSADRQ